MRKIDCGELSAILNTLYVVQFSFVYCSLAVLSVDLFPFYRHTMIAYTLRHDVSKLDTVYTVAKPMG